MSDDEHGASRHQPVHALFNELFRPGIDGAGGLIQNQHRRIGTGSTGNVQQLPLALAEAAALAGEDRLVAVRQMADEGIRARQPGRGLHFLVGGLQTAIADVVRHGAGKEVGILQHHAQRPPQGVLLDVPNIDAVVGDGAGLDLIEPVDEAGDGGLCLRRWSLQRRSSGRAWQRGRCHGE